MVLYPHQGGHEADDLDRQAMLLNAPLYIQPEYAHAGDLEPVGSLVRVEGGSVMLDAMKLAEDGSGDVILHLHETAREETDAVLDMPLFNVKTELHFAPGQIRVLRLNKAERTWTENDLLEREIRK